MLDWLLLRGSLIAFCILANAFFVAAEFALVSVRETRIEHLVARKRPAARTALRLKREIDQVLPAVQLGVTLANLVLGALGEPTIAAAIEHRLAHVRPGSWLGALEAAHPTLIAHGIAVPLLFASLRSWKLFWESWFRSHSRCKGRNESPWRSLVLWTSLSGSRGQW